MIVTLLIFVFISTFFFRGYTAYAKTKVDFPNIPTTNTSSKIIIKDYSKEEAGESVSDPDVIRKKPLQRDSVSGDSSRVDSRAEIGSDLGITASALSESSITASLGPNLIQNGSLEFANGSLPINWRNSRWLSNTGSFIYPITGINGGKAARITTTSYSSGDAKWYFDDVPVQSGRLYQFSEYSSSTVETTITIQYRMSNNTYIYRYLGTISAGPFKQNTYEFVPPSRAIAMTVFHSLGSNGILDTDEYSLNEIIVQNDENLVINGDMELSGTNNSPIGWKKGKWRENGAVFSYPVSGVSGSRAVKVSMSSYSSGDAKWYFEPIEVSLGKYFFDDQYISDVTTQVTVQFENSDGTFSYKWIGDLPPSSSFKSFSAVIDVPQMARRMTVFHLLAGVGSLTIDNVSLNRDGGNIFTTGAISLAFDDGWESQWDNAVPKLDSVGMKGNFYIITTHFSDYGYSGYMSTAQVRSLYNNGHLIGAHTRNHPHLTTLSLEYQRDEIEGSRSDLRALGLGEVNTFVYPFGEYDLNVIDVVISAGFNSARSTIRGYNSDTSDEYQLVHQSVESDTTIGQVRAWIDSALANKKWLILTFHRVSYDGDRYTVTPEVFAQIVDYLVSKNARIISVEEGISDMQ